MKRPGFTLMELLVVISIIGLLTGIVLPALAAVRRQARQTTCEANIRQLSTLLHLYNTENHTLPPGFYATYPIPSSQQRMLGPIDIPALWWFFYIDAIPDQPHPEHSLLQCPANQLTSVFKYNLLYGNYGVNWSLCRSPTTNPNYNEYRGQPLSLASLQHPGQTLLLADSGYSLIAWQHTLPSDHTQALSRRSRSLDNAYIPGAGVNIEREPLSPFPEDSVDAIDGRHPNQTVNVGYADGHVAAEKADDLVVQPLDSEGEFTNLSPLWKP